MKSVKPEHGEPYVLLPWVVLIWIKFAESQHCHFCRVCRNSLKSSEARLHLCTTFTWHRKTNIKESSPASLSRSPPGVSAELGRGKKQVQRWPHASQMISAGRPSSALILDEVTASEHLRIPQCPATSQDRSVKHKPPDYRLIQVWSILTRLGIRGEWEMKDVFGCILRQPVIILETQEAERGGINPFLGWNGRIIIYMSHRSHD